MQSKASLLQTFLTAVSADPLLDHAGPSCHFRLGVQDVNAITPIVGVLVGVLIGIPIGVPIGILIESPLSLPLNCQVLLGPAAAQGVSDELF
jgi:hypothetical protein